MPTEMRDDDIVERYLRALTDAPGPEGRQEVYTRCQEQHVHLLGDLFMAMIEYQASVIDHLTTQLAEAPVEFPRDGKRLDLKDIEVEGDA